MRFSLLGGARRVTWFPAGDPRAWKARAGIGGIDLDPEPGSPAAVREERARRHPGLYRARHAAAGVATVAVPLLLVYLASRLVFSLPWPVWNLPSVPWPDIDLPSIPWPDWTLPDWQPPAWVGWVLDRLKFLWPVLVGLGLAGGEVHRRRKQDQIKAELRKRRGPERPSRSLKSDDQDPDDFERKRDDRPEAEGEERDR